MKTSFYQMPVLCFFGLLLLYTQVQAVVLSKTIMGLQELHAFQGECESGWREQVQSSQVITLDENVSLILVPCALWTHNMAWTAYLEIKEPSRPEGLLTKSVRFIDYNPGKGLFASDQAYNISVDAGTKTMTSHFLLNGKEVCGHHAEYKWDSNQQAMILKQLLVQDNCVGLGSPWKVLVDNSKSND